MKINVEMIYICHYKKLSERKEKILKQLHDFGIKNYIFVEHFDKDSLDEIEINRQYPKINDLKTNMSAAQKSLALKHAWIVEDTSRKEYNSVLVLEDDVVLCGDFPKYFNLYMQQLPKDWDIGWVGSCFHLKEPQIDGINVYKTDRGSRCTHAFCLSGNFARRMWEEMRNINMPSDFYYNHIVKKFDINNYWFQPPLALQSLEFTSSLKNQKWDPKEVG